MILALFLYSCGNWVLWAWLPLLLRDAGLSAAAVGDLTGLHQLAAALALLPIGWWTDRWSPRALCAAGAAMLVAGCLAIGFAGVGVGHAPLGPGVAAIGVGGSVFLVAINALFYKRLSTEAHGTDVGRFISASLLGYAAGPVLGAPLAGSGLAADAFGAAAVFAAVLVASARLPRTDPVPIHPADYARDLLRPGPLFLLAAIVVTSSHSGFEYVGLPLVAEDAAGLDRAGMAVLYGAIGLWTALLTARIGRRFDLSPRPVLLLAAGVALSGVFQALTPYASGLFSLLAVRLAHTVGDSLFLVLIGVLTARAFPRARIGGLFALTQFARVGTMAVAASAAGRLTSGFGHEGAFGVSGALLLLGAAAFTVLRAPIRRAVGLPARVPKTAEAQAPAADEALAARSTR